ncbi:MAG TPA: AraC family transcriptional regulator [Abditibacteriaceae bacterium]
MSHLKPDDMLALPRVHWAARDTLKPGTIEAGIGRESMLFYVEQGQMQTTIAGETFQSQIGTLLILPRGLSYHQHIEHETQLLFVFFAPCRFEFEDTPRTLQIEPDDCIVRWMRDLAVLQTQSNLQRDIIDHLLAALLARVRQVEGRFSALKSLHPSVAAVVQWMDEHLEEPATLQSLAAQAHCSPSHLRALFKQQVGSGVLRYQQDRRMQRALELLNQPHLSLTEVARRCGYNDVEYFSRLFRRYHHIAPGRMRRKQ